MGTKTITMETRIQECVCVCVLGVLSTCVIFFTTADSMSITEVCLLRKDEHASIWRAKSTMSVSGQLMPCDDRRTLVRRKTG